MILPYLKYLLKAGNKHGLHSPFVYDLYSDVILEQKHYYAYDLVESLRARMLLSEDVIETQDFGTGKNQYPIRRKVSFIARRFSAPRRCAQLLFRLADHFNPEYILEAGTSLGITTAYLASANSHAKVFTLEGCPETARLAQTNFRLLKLSNITLLIGEFNETLPKALEQMPRVDLVYLDGNHRRKPTIDYFNLCMTKTTDRSVVILDDIHWSREMEQAWDDLKKDPRVTASIDLFHLGILFFQKGQAKEDFVLKY